MSETTGIHWCDSSKTPVIGCDPVSPGCAHCWARSDTPARVLRAGKWPGMVGRKVETWGASGERVRVKSFAESLLAWDKKPWICDHCGKAFGGHRDLDGNNHCVHEGREPSAHRRRVFIGDSCDIFDPKWPVPWLAETLDTLRQTPNLIHILCTKRPELWRERLQAVHTMWTNDHANQGWRWLDDWMNCHRPPPNIVLLTSVEDQQRANERIPALLRIPAACRGLSLEPLLGTVRLNQWLLSEHGRRHIGAEPGLSWVIIGTESGPHRRNQIDYAEHASSLIRQGLNAGVSVFHKQMPVNGKVSTNPAEWPEQFRVQQWPKGF